MLAHSQRAAAGQQEGVDALLSALLFGGLALFLPALCSWLPRELVAWSRGTWLVASGHDLDALAPLMLRGLRPLFVGLLGLLALGGLGWLGVWRLRAAQSIALAGDEDRLFPSLLGGVLWLVGSVALLPRWLELTAWPTESYAATLLTAARGILWLCAMAALLRLVLSLRR